MKKETKIRIMKTPILGATILFVVLLRGAWRYFSGPLLNMLSWLFRSREVANYTYDLTETNKRYLAALIADITWQDFNEIIAYIHEIDEDESLKRHIESQTRKSHLAFMADSEVRFGWRVGWHAFMRALKPKVVVETGVDKGLGSCVLISALTRNKEDGYEGYYYGTDIDKDASYLLSSKQKEFGKVLYGDSIKSLKRFNKKIDIFINDSDHSSGYEANEYLTVEPALAKASIVLGDNSHVTSKLLEVSLKTGRQFIFFQEKPLNHWYPGAGIGISFTRQGGLPRAQSTIYKV